MGKKVTIRTLVSMAGPHFSLMAGDEWEVDEEVAAIRVAKGLAEYIETPPDDDESPADEDETADEPPAERQIVTHGAQVAETAAVDPAAAETRTPLVAAARRRRPRR